MRGVDHLVLAGRDLDAMRARYRDLGFTLTPPGRHPFGTINSLVQFAGGCFLELASIGDPPLIPEHGPRSFSFAAFNRDFLARGEGFSLLVLDAVDAAADAAAFAADGIGAFDPFHFSRRAKLPSGDEATVGFTLAFAREPAAPDAGFFVCQQHAPQHFWKTEYQSHANGGQTVTRVIMVAERPADMARFLSAFSGVEARATEGGLEWRTARGALEVLTPEAYFDIYRMTPPPLARGPRFAGFAVAAENLDHIRVAAGNAGVPLVGRRGRLIVPPEFAFGCAIAFERA